MADECHGALDLPTESLDFTHGFSWTLHHRFSPQAGGRHHEVVGILEILHRSRCDGDGGILSDAYFDGRPLKKTENKMRQKERAFSGLTLVRSASDGGITNRPDGLK